MAKYYYQFPIDSEAGKRLTKFHRACVDAANKAEKYAKRMGAESYYEDPNFFAGGVSCVAFKEPRKVNTDVWRMAYKDEDGTQWFEPNVRTSIGCVKAKEGFTPSDVAGRIYKKETVGWDAVRQFYSLKEWLAFCGFHSSGDKEVDTKIVIGMLKDKRFYTYIEIIPLTAPAAGRKRSKDGSKAIRAEQMRMGLPTVHVDDFYAIVGADTRPEKKGEGGCKVVPLNPAAAKEQGEPQEAGACTPVFFSFQGFYYIGLDYPINQDGSGGVPVTEIPQGRFVAMSNAMLREAKEKTTI